MSWKLIAAFLGAALAASLLFPPGVAGQDQGGKTEQEKIDQRKKQQADRDAHRMAGNVETLRQMQGGWQMVEFRSPDLPDAGRDDAAFLVVSAEFLAIELHMAYFSELGEEEESFLQTGTYRLNFNTYGNLIATLLIGSADTPHGQTLPLPPGRISVFEVEVKNGTLVMLADDGTRFSFERMATGPLTLRVFEETDWLPGAKKVEVEADKTEKVEGDGE